MDRLPEKEEADFRQLLNAYLEGKLEEDGINELFSRIRKNTPSGRRALLEESRHRFLVRQEDAPPLTKEDSRRIWERLMKETAPRPRIYAFRRLRAYVAVIAGVILAGALGYLFFVNRNEQSGLAHREKTRQRTSNFKNDIPPGDNKAILTLADGSAIVLDSVSDGELLRTAATVIVKSGSGQLNYQPNPAWEKGKSGGPTSLPDDLHMPVTYNTITTPRGGQYQVVLSDGTKVWMNSASQLRFPTRFTGNRRLIELEGEAYLEVADNAQQPFEVSINGTTIRVLGTSFNIMGYPEEKNLVTTLVSGSVQVIRANTVATLLPGEHAVVAEDGRMQVKKANVEEEIAWKNGLIQYSRASIRQIMRQVSRWYNVDVVYEGDMSNKDFACAVSRRAHVSELLKILELTGAVHFLIDGNKITVKP